MVLLARASVHRKGQSKGCVVSTATETERTRQPVHISDNDVHEETHSTSTSFTSSEAEIAHKIFTYVEEDEPNSRPRGRIDDEVVLITLISSHKTGEEEGVVQGQVKQKVT